MDFDIWSPESQDIGDQIDAFLYHFQTMLGMN